MPSLTQQTYINLAFACQVLLVVFVFLLVVSVGKRIIKARAQKQIEEELVRKQQLEIQARMLAQMEQQTHMTEEQLQLISVKQQQGLN